MMKRIFSFFLSVILILSSCVTVFAEMSDDEALPPELKFGMQWYSRFNEHYIYGENLNMAISVLSAEVYAKYEKIFLYIDCNKDVVEWEYKDFGKNMHIETETGYVTEFDTIDLYYGTVPDFFDCTIKSFGNPDVSIRAEGITRNGERKEIALINDLPVNKVYSEDEIPHIEASVTPPVFFDTNQFWFMPSNRLYIFSPVTVREILNMLSVSGDGGEIKYISKDGAEHEYPRTNDVFALEFEGKFCDVLYVFIVGDADNDGFATASDARIVLRQSAKLEAENLFCDVNYDNKTDAADARMILRVAAKLDFFRLADLTVWQNQPNKVGPLVSASDGGYLWRCTVSEKNAIEITEIIEPSVDNTGKTPEEIIVGAPALQTFILKPTKQGRFEVKFELIRPWENKPINEFGFTIIVDDVLN